MTLKTSILFFLLCISAAFADAQVIKNLVFEGAGMKGLAYVGVLEILEEEGHLGGLEKVGGTSAGAIVAMLLSLDYTVAEVQEILEKTKFQKFNHGGPGAFRRLKRKFGWFKSKKVVSWLEKLIEQKTGNRDITFQQLVDQGYRPLYVVTTSLKQQRRLVLSHELYPNMRVKDAVRASMSIPFYFEAVFMDDRGSVYPDYGQKPDLDILVDGGINGNYPIFLFDSVFTDNQGIERRIANMHTVGVRIDSEDQIKQDLLERKVLPQPIDNFRDYIRAFYTYAMNNLNRVQMTPADWNRTISVSSAGISPVIKKFSNEEKQRLVESGRQFTLRYLSQNVPN